MSNSLNAARGLCKTAETLQLYSVVGIVNNTDCSKPTMIIKTPRPIGAVNPRSRTWLPWHWLNLCSRLRSSSLSHRPSCTVIHTSKNCKLHLNNIIAVVVSPFLSFLWLESHLLLHWLVCMCFHLTKVLMLTMWHCFCWYWLVVY